MVTDTTSTATRDAAHRLRRASSTGVPCAPVRDLIGSDDVVAAYEVQRLLAEARIAEGATVVGRKVGLTSPAVQAQLGVDRPDFGVLFDDMAVADGGTVAPGLLLQPKIEVEVAFVLAHDLDGDLDAATVAAAVGHARAALEIVDSRIAGWDITFGDTVADNGSSALYVLGEAEVPLAEVEPRAVTMELRRGGTVESSGDGSACLGDPLAALAWLARTAQEHGSPLRAGDLVLSGALGPMVSVVPGDVFEASLSGLGTVSVTFSAEVQA